MAEENGWWEITFTVEPDDVDLEHIAHKILEGYTEGVICKREE